MDCKSCFSFNWMLFSSVLFPSEGSFFIVWHKKHTRTHGIYIYNLVSEHKNNDLDGNCTLIDPWQTHRQMMSVPREALTRTPVFTISEDAALTYIHFLQAKALLINTRTLNEVLSLIKWFTSCGLFFPTERGKFPQCDCVNRFMSPRYE